jgi:hypothetical protein
MQYMNCKAGRRRRVKKAARRWMELYYISICFASTRCNDELMVTKHVQLLHDDGMVMQRMAGGLRNPTITG